MLYLKHRGKATEAATLNNGKLHRYKRRAVTIASSGGSFLSLEDCIAQSNKGNDKDTKLE